MTVPAGTPESKVRTFRKLGRCPAQEPLDQRVPREVWECIFNRLYPSQLTRLSMVNKNFNSIVVSLSLWSRMFSSTHGPKKRLRCLRGMPESKSYMLYMCANSPHVCEQCLGAIAFTGLTVRPKSRLAQMPTLSTKEFEYAGEALNKDWKINMCESCNLNRRQAWSGMGSRYLDNATKERIGWYRSQE